jgi:hypothetical protein
MRKAGGTSIRKFLNLAKAKWPGLHPDVMEYYPVS